MKNLNKVRTVHNVAKIVIFNDFKEMARFVNLYKDLFYLSEDHKLRHNNIPFYAQTDVRGDKTLYFTISKNDWEMITKHVDLEYVSNTRNRVWKYVG